MQFSLLLSFTINHHRAAAQSNVSALGLFLDSHFTHAHTHLYFFRKSTTSTKSTIAEWSYLLFTLITLDATLEADEDLHFGLNEICIQVKKLIDSVAEGMVHHHTERLHQLLDAYELFAKTSGHVNKANKFVIDCRDRIENLLINASKIQARKWPAV